MTIDFNAIRAKHPIEAVIGRFVELKRNGHELIGLCPFHQDTKPSLTVYHKDGAGRFYCFACGAGEDGGDVVDFVAKHERISLAEAAARLEGGQLPDPGPRMPPLKVAQTVEWTPILPVPADTPGLTRDAFRAWNPKRDSFSTAKPSRLDAYRDTEGRLLGYVARIEVPDRKITPTVTFCAGPDGRREWAFVPFPEPRPLQGLDDLVTAPYADVVIVEGEKAAEAARMRLTDPVVMTWPGGAKAVDKADWSVLAGRHVVLWPDADEPGLAAMARIAELIPSPARIQVVDTTGLPKGFDAADLPADEDMAEWLRARRRPLAPPEAPAEKDPQPSKLQPPRPAPATAPWPEPINLLGKFDPPMLRKEWLPKALVPFVMDQADLLGVDPSSVGMAALVACAAVIDDALEIQPKRHDPTWTEQARLWGAIVGDPSTRKTPAIRKATSHLRKIDMAMTEATKKSVMDYERELKVFKRAEATYATQQAKGRAVEAPQEPKRPAEKRLMTEDATIEALGKILQDNERGVLQISDELTGWLGAMDAYKSGAGGKDRAYWLELYNGGSRRIDRVGRGYMVVPNWSACIIGGIQPDAIRKVADTLYDDGLLQRFMAIVCQPAVAEPKDRPPDMDAIKGYRAMLDHLLATQPGQGPITLSEEAHRQREAVSKFAGSLTQSEMLPTSLRAHLGKWDGLFARLLLVFHACECAVLRVHPATLPVPADTARRVHAFMLDFLFPHAWAFYTRILGNAWLQAHMAWIAEFVLARRLEILTLREVMQAYRQWRAVPDWQQRQTLRSLEDAGWIRSDGATLERRVNRWEVNPQVHVLFEEQAKAASAKREAGRNEVAIITKRLESHGRT